MKLLKTITAFLFAYKVLLFCGNAVVLSNDDKTQDGSILYKGETMYKIFGSPLDQLTPLGMKTYLEERPMGRLLFWLDLLEIKVRDYRRAVLRDLPGAFRWVAWILAGNTTNQAKAAYWEREK